MENAMQTLLPGFFILITVVILGMLVYLTLKGMQEKKANDAAPIVTVDAKVKAKRIAVHHSAHQQSMNGVPLMAKSHHTTYYATFALEGDQRLELQISEGQFQRLTEGERGKLTYQRKRFHRFEGEDA
mgnify:FL=1